jgi:hypothetical protein
LEQPISEDLIFKVDPTEIEVDQDLPRHRKDLGEIRRWLSQSRRLGRYSLSLSAEIKN